MNPLEIAAVLLGLANVALVVRRSMWNYPFGIAMVSLYFFIFFDARLYSDALLQIFFLVVNLYGWRNWLRSRRLAGEVVVTILSLRARIAWAAGTVAACAAWGTFMATYTDAAAPIPDAAIAGTSVAAQILLAQRRLENWLLWILVDMAAIGLFASRGLYLTSGLYVAFLGMACWGLFSWLRAWRADPSPARA